jgi:hypothetical protein
LFLVALACLAVAGCRAKTAIPPAATVAVVGGAGAETDEAVAVSPAKLRMLIVDKGEHVFEVSGIPKDAAEELAKLPKDDPGWQTRFAVFALADQKASIEGRPAMAGSYSLDQTKLRFTPRYPPEPGVIYRAVYRPSEAAAKEQAAGLTADFEVPSPRTTPPTELTAVYPSRDKLPENQLKFYLHFSAPMSRGEAYERVRLLDAAGQAIELPFLELGEELWDGDLRRFTLFFDPGRIKRGLKPREEVGPVLEEGKRYTLVVDRAWRDAAGRPLAGESRKSFEVGPPDDAPPDPATWKLDPPAAGSRQPLRVEFPESLDRALLGRLLNIERGGETVPGEISIADDEMLWQFAPRDAWRAGGHQLVVGTALEDLGGNSISRPFEVDELKPVTSDVAAEFVRVPFEVQ